MGTILKPHRESPFTSRAEAELFLLILYRSHWGQRGVKLTNAVADKVRIFRFDQTQGAAPIGAQEVGCELSAGQATRRQQCGRPSCPAEPYHVIECSITYERRRDHR